MQQIVTDSRELFRQAAIIGCFTVSRPVSNLSASCLDVAASLWPAVPAAAYSSQPRLPLEMGSARDNGAQVIQAYTTSCRQVERSMGLGIPGSVLFKGGVTTWRLATAVAVCSILEGLVETRRSLHCDDVLLIETVVGLHIARWSPFICHSRTFGHDAIVAVLLSAEDGAQGTSAASSEYNVCTLEQQRLASQGSGVGHGLLESIRSVPQRTQMMRFSEGECEHCWSIFL